MFYKAGVLQAASKLKSLHGVLGRMQVEGMAVKHSEVTLKKGSQAVSAVRTTWPVGSPYVLDIELSKSLIA
jgi:hypothetical protein